jgi:hypothetical protein
MRWRNDDASALCLVVVPDFLPFVDWTAFWPILPSLCTSVDTVKREAQSVDGFKLWLKPRIYRYIGQCEGRCWIHGRRLLDMAYSLSSSKLAKSNFGITLSDFATQGSTINHVEAPQFTRPQSELPC